MIRDGRKLPANPLDSAPDFVNRMRLDNDVVAVIVFGSAAQGMLKPLSDIDLAILLSNRLSKDARMEKQLDLLGIANSIFRTAAFRPSGKGQRNSCRFRGKSSPFLYQIQLSSSQQDIPSGHESSLVAYFFSMPVLSFFSSSANICFFFSAWAA